MKQEMVINGDQDLNNNILIRKKKRKQQHRRPEFPFTEKYIGTGGDCIKSNKNSTEQLSICRNCKEPLENRNNRE